METTFIRPLGDAGTANSFLLVVDTANFGPQSITFTATSAQDMPPAGPVVVGSADAAGDGLAEIFVLVDAGCCTQFWTVFRPVNGHLAQVIRAGQPAELAVGGSVMDNAGFSCDGSGHDLVTYGYYGENAGTFRVTRDEYRWAAPASPSYRSIV